MLEEINMGGNDDSFMKPWLFIGCYSGNGRYNYYKSDIGNSMDTNGNEETVPILTGKSDQAGFQLVWTDCI